LAYGFGGFDVKIVAKVETGRRSLVLSPFGNVEGVRDVRLVWECDGWEGVASRTVWLGRGRYTATSRSAGSIDTKTWNLK